MKKIYTFISALFVALGMSITSCSVENNLTDEPAPQQPVATRTVTLMATTNMGANTRLVVEEIEGKDAFNITGWKEGDVIYVGYMNEHENINEIKFTYADGVFTGEVPEYVALTDIKLAHTGNKISGESNHGRLALDFKMEPENIFLVGEVTTDGNSLQAELSAPYALACVHNNTEEDLEVGLLMGLFDDSHELIEKLYAYGFSYYFRSSNSGFSDGCTGYRDDCVYATVPASSKAYFAIPLGQDAHDGYLEQRYGLINYATDAIIAAPREVEAGVVYKVQYNGDPVSLFKSDEIQNIVHNPMDYDLASISGINFVANQEMPENSTGDGNCWYQVEDGVLTFCTTEESFENEGSPLELQFNNFTNLKSVDLSNVILKIKDEGGVLFPHSIKSITFSEVVSGGSLKELFVGCSSLESIDLSGFYTDNVTDMASMFSGCSSLQSITFGDNFDTSSVENMISMFDGCSSLQNLDLSGFDTSNVTDMSSMFLGCSSLQSITFGENFSTQNVTEMNSMFDGCSSLQSLDLSGFNTRSVINIAGMFWNCKKLASLTLGNWDVSQIHNTSFMFTNTGSKLTSGKCVVKGVTDATLKTWLMTGTGWDDNHIMFPIPNTEELTEDPFNW